MNITYNSLTPSQYNTRVEIVCSTPEDSFDPSNSQLQIRWSDNSRTVTNDSRFRVEPFQTQLRLVITSLTAELNGNYVCTASNSRGMCSQTVRVIGEYEHTVCTCVHDHMDTAILMVIIMCDSRFTTSTFAQVMIKTVCVQCSYVHCTCM